MKSAESAESVFCTQGAESMKAAENTLSAQCALSAESMENAESALYAHSTQNRECPMKAACRQTSIMFLSTPQPHPLKAPYPAG